MKSSVKNVVLKKALSIGLRLALALGIIAFLLYKIDTRSLAAILRESLSHWPWLIAGIFFSYLTLHAGIIRWQMILDAQGLTMSRRNCFNIYFIGQFFNAFMFGSTGGDLVRAVYAARETHHKKTEAVATVLIDRVVGLLVLFLMAGAMLALRAQFFLSHWETHLPALLILGMIVLTVVFLWVIFNIKRFNHWPLAKRIRRNPTLSQTIQRMLIAVYLYRRRTAVLGWTSVLSLLAQVFTIVQCYCIGRCFLINLGFLDYLTVVPIVISVSALPITPGGLGIREGAAVALFSAMGIASAQSLPLALLLYFISVGWSLLGGAIFIGHSASAGHTAREELLEIEQETAREDGEAGVPGAHQ